jgi:hypothetical protein
VPKQRVAQTFTGVTAFSAKACKTALQARFIQDGGSEWINACSIEVPLPGDTLSAASSLGYPH